MDNISGLTVKEEFISAELEKEILAKVDRNGWQTSLKRRVQHYGYTYDYKARKIDASLYLGELPNWSLPVTNKLGKEPFISERFDQLIVNEYLPGQGISPHIDCVPCFKETIVSLSLGSRCEMVFHGPSCEKEILILEPRTLLVLQKDARFKWKHSIPSRKSDVVNGARVQRERRVSLTFRTIIESV